MGDPYCTLAPVVPDSSGDVSRAAVIEETDKRGGTWKEHDVGTALQVHGSRVGFPKRISENPAVEMYGWFQPTSGCSALV